MSIFYLNHCVICSQETVGSVKRKLEELISIQKHIRSKHAQLYIYSEFWKVNVLDGAINLHTFILEYYDRTAAMTTIYAVMNSGPFYDSRPEQVNMDVSPEIEMLSFIRMLFDACINDNQQLIASFSCENQLIHSKYNITLESNKEFKLNNYLGKQQIDTYFSDRLLFDNIENVIINLDANLKKTEILGAAKKSARGHNFQGRQNEVHKVISALEKIELKLIIEGVNEEERKQCFYESTGYKISKESVNTMSVEKFRRERQFTIEIGKIELFEWHIKIGRNIRIHYFVDKDKEKVYVGHCGRHLGTTTYNS